MPNGKIRKRHFLQTGRERLVRGFSRKPEDDTKVTPNAISIHPNKAAGRLSRPTMSPNASILINLCSLARSRCHYFGQLIARASNLSMYLSIIFAPERIPETAAPPAAIGDSVFQARPAKIPARPPRNSPLSPAASALAFMPAQKANIVSRFSLSCCCCVGPLFGADATSTVADEAGHIWVCR